MHTRIIYFLFANIILAILFVGDSFYKHTHNGISIIDNSFKNKSVDSIKNTTLTPENIKTAVNQPVVLQVESTKTPAQLVSTAIKSQCLLYGPINVNNKNTIDVLLQQANILSSTVVINKPVYEIFWNLGKNKTTAMNLFEKQKNDGPLSDEKFKLKTTKTGEWIVPIADITADEQTTLITTKELSDKANKSNTGGTWEYRVKESTYFYQFKESSIIPIEVKAVMDKTFQLPQAPC